MADESKYSDDEHYDEDDDGGGGGNRSESPFIALVKQVCYHPAKNLEHLALGYLCVLAARRGVKRLTLVLCIKSDRGQSDLNPRFSPP